MAAPFVGTRWPRRFEAVASQFNDDLGRMSRQCPRYVLEGVLTRLVDGLLPADGITNMPRMLAAVAEELPGGMRSLIKEQRYIWTRLDMLRVSTGGACSPWRPLFHALMKACQDAGVAAADFRAIRCESMFSSYRTMPSWTADQWAARMDAYHSSIMLRIMCAQLSAHEEEDAEDAPARKRPRMHDLTEARSETTGQ